MAWLQKRPQVSDPQMFYSIGLNKTVLVVGLGNPGKKYEPTRHNVGFLCLDEFIRKNSEMEAWIIKKNLKSQISSGRLNDTRVIAIKPTTYMNLSGEAVRAVSDFYKIKPEHILIVHDELDIEFGQIRLRLAGSDAGHNGIKSVTEAIGDNYYRVRIGIGPKTPADINSEDFVLQQFNAKEQAQLPNLTKEVNAIISEFVYSTQLPQETRSFIV